MQVVITHPPMWMLVHRRLSGQLLCARMTNGYLVWGMLLPCQLQGARVTNGHLAWGRLLSGQLQGSGATTALAAHEELHDTCITIFQISQITLAGIRACDKPLSWLRSCCPAQALCNNCCA